MDLGAKERLRHLETIGERRRGHPDIDAEAGHIRLPHVLGQIELCQLAGKTEIAADGLAHLLAVQRAGERINDAVGDGAVKLVAMIERRDIIETAIQHRFEQQLDPLRRDAPEVGIDHHTSLGVQRLRHLEHGAERAALAGDARVRERHLEHGFDAVMQQDGAEIANGSVVHDFHGAVAGAAVGIDDNRLVLGEILGQPALHRAHHMADGVRAVEAGDADNNIGLPELFELLMDISPERDCVHNPDGLLEDETRAAIRSPPRPLAGEGWGEGTGMASFIIKGNYSPCPLDCFHLITTAAGSQPPFPATATAYPSRWCQSAR